MMNEQAYLMFIMMSDRISYFNRNKGRLHITEGAVEAETEASESLRSIVKGIADMLQMVSITSDGYYLAAHFPVKLKYIIMRMHKAESSVETACIYLDSLAVIYHLLESGFKNLQIIL